MTPFVNPMLRCDHASEKKKKHRNRTSRDRRTALRAAQRAALVHMEEEDRDEATQHVAADNDVAEALFSPTHPRQQQQQQHEPQPQPRHLLPLFSEAFMCRPPLGTRDRLSYDRILPGELPYAAGDGSAWVFPLGDYTHFGPFGSSHRMHLLDNLAAACVVECAPSLRAIQWLPSVAERHLVRSRLQLFFSNDASFEFFRGSVHFRILCSGLVVPIAAPSSDPTSMDRMGIFRPLCPRPSNYRRSLCPPQTLLDAWTSPWSLPAWLCMSWTPPMSSSKSAAFMLPCNGRRDPSTGS